MDQNTEKMNTKEFFPKLFKRAGSNKCEQGGKFPKIVKQAALLIDTTGIEIVDYLYTGSPQEAFMGAY